MAEQMIGLILRHGETAANREGLFRSWSDPPLNDEGTQQAIAAARFLKQFKIQHVISSPLLRAFVTADFAAAPHGLMVKQHRGLFPWRLGIFTGLSKDEYQPALRLFVQNPNVCVPEGESLSDFEDRQYAFWKAALEMARNEGLTLYVAHTSNVTALENFTQGMEEIEPELGESVKPGGVGAIYWDGKGHRLEPMFGQTEQAVFGGS
jgi:broad specificity phosphatase PhoE